MEFYKDIFDAELTTTPNPNGKGIMHADLTSDEISFFASDGDRTEPYGPSFISMSLTGSDTEKLTTIFNKLSEGGRDIVPLKVESWGDTFGSLTDKFGVDWMVNISAV